MDIEIHCKYDELLDVKSVKPDPANRNKHDKGQIDQLAKIIEYQGWRWPLVINKETGILRAGHGRLAAAKKLKLKTVPVVYQDFKDSDQDYAFMVSDNAIGQQAEIDMAGINLDLENLGPDFDLDWLGIKDFKLDAFEKEEDENPYTRKIESPIYEIQGEKPSIEMLFDTNKTDELIKKIEKSKVSNIMKNFLRLAAHRHTKFNYKNIAEYYAYASQEEKNLFEQSALVIIDFEKAIELGFVKLTQKVREEYDKQE